MLRSACAICSIACSAAVAAPLDAFLTARHPNESFKPEVEASYDVVNRTVDVFHLRQEVADGSEAGSGNYHGAHLRLGMGLSPSWWTDGGLWTRKIQYANGAADITTWQFATQYKAIDGGDHGFSLALRAGAWGDSAPELHKTSSPQAATATSVTQTHPRDRQLQLDLIGTWSPTPAIDVTAFASGGSSRVSFDQISGTSQTNAGCPFNIDFTDTAVVATCQQHGNTIVVTVPNAVAGVNVNQEARYSATYLSAGVNASWKSGDWRLRGGYQYLRFDRGAVDDVVVQRGGTPYQSNQFVLAEVGFQLRPDTLVFTRAQVMSRLFVGEAPLTYNASTAAQHRNRYGILSLGVVYQF